MSGIRGTDTKPELEIRRGLHRRGFRYRLHDRRLPGRPDLVFPGRKAVIFVNGCFWHGHDCHLFRWPRSRKAFWRSKITGNRLRDIATRTRLLDEGWRVCSVWECALKGRKRQPADSVVGRCAVWLASTQQELEIQGE